MRILLCKQWPVVRGKACSDAVNQFPDHPDPSSRPCFSSEFERASAFCCSAAKVLDKPDLRRTIQFVHCSNSWAFGLDLAETPVPARRLE